MARSVVLILFGGRSAEHEVSILSARFVVDALDRERFEPLLVAIDRRGSWRLQTEAQLPRGQDAGQVRLCPDAPLAWLRPMPADGDRPGRLHLEDGRALAFDVAFPVLHGPLGEDGCVQGLLELAQVPYVGANVTASAVGMDKAMQKQLLAQAGLPVVGHHAFGRGEYQRARAEQLAAGGALGWPVFVKPANLGSSVGISRVRSAAELCPAIDLALALDDKILVEQGIEGCREIELGVLGDDEPLVSEPGEIVVKHRDGFYSYEAKYLDPSGAELRIPAPLLPAERASMQLLALRAYRAIDCSGMARVDFFLGRDGQVFVNELNTIPGFTAISMYPRLWQASGLGPVALVSKLIDLGRERHRRRTSLRTSR